MLIILFPYKFSNFFFKKYQVKDLKKKLKKNLEIHDVSNIIFKKKIKLVKSERHKSVLVFDKIKEWENRIEELEHEISLLKNTIAGLEEEEKVINSNRNVNGEGQMLDLERIKQISAYYRERITKIKNEIFKTNLNINKIKLVKLISSLVRLAVILIQ